ncbi:hypothetical protein ACGVWS_04995 [Enterobacteriaceae bacterium LUAb1]
MGLFINIVSVAIGTRFRDDYGAGMIRCISASRILLSSIYLSRCLRSFPVVQSSMAGAMGRLSHDA